MRSSASTVEQLLDGGDRRSVGQVARVVARARKDPFTVQEIVTALRSARPLVAMRAADALEKISRHDAASLAPYRRQVVAAAVRTSDPVVRWNLIQCFPRLAHSRLALRQLVRRLEVWYLNDPSAIVRVSALEACVELGRGDAKLEEVGRRLVAEALSAPGAAVRARARRLAAKASVLQRPA